MQDLVTKHAERGGSKSLASRVQQVQTDRGVSKWGPQATPMHRLYQLLKEGLAAVCGSKFSTFPANQGNTQEMLVTHFLLSHWHTDMYANNVCRSLEGMSAPRRMNWVPLLYPAKQMNPH